MFQVTHFYKIRLTAHTLGLFNLYFTTLNNLCLIYYIFSLHQHGCKTLITATFNNFYFILNF